MATFYYRDARAPQPTRSYRVGVVALIEDGTRLLIERRSDNGQWGLIGGSVDENEALTDALCREVMEETGLTVTGYSLFGTFSDPTRIAAYPDGNVVRLITLVYRVTVADLTPLRHSDESTALAFIARDELAQRDWVITHREIVEHYLATRAVKTPLLH